MLESKQTVSSLNAFLSQIRIGPAQKKDEWQIVPLLASVQPANITPLMRAKILELVELEEISHGGRVSEVYIYNKSHKPVLCLDGEQIIGARQNRIFNATYLIGPQSKVLVSVSCVEQNRWSYTSGRSFECSGEVAPPSVRTNKQIRVSRATISGRPFDADQHAVWRDVQGVLVENGVFSASMAMNAATHARRPEIDRLVDEFKPLPRQVGYAAFRNGNPICLEILADSILFADAWPTLARGVFAEIGNHTPKDDDVAVSTKGLLDRMMMQKFTMANPPGVGKLWLEHGPNWAITALEYGERFVHILVGISTTR